MTQRTDDAAEAWRWQRWIASGLPTADVPDAAPARVAQTVGRFGCVQAQEFDMTLWSLAQRTGSTREEVLAAIASREVLRTHALRVTWHFVRRDDLASVQTATADRVHKVLRPMLRADGIDDATLAAWGAHLRDVLSDGPLTRPEIAARLQGTPFAYQGTTLGLVMMWAELEQLVASGPPRGMTHTYQLVEPGGPRPDGVVHPSDRAAADPAVLDRALPDQAESVAWLVGRFLASHGPSSVRDVCSWSSLTVTAVRQALADLGEEVHSAEVLGIERHWIGARAEGTWPATPTVTLLNGYDEYISGLDPRAKALLDPDGLYRVRPGTPVAILMVDGKLAGHWRRTRSASQVRVEVTALRPLSGAERDGLEHEARRYGAFAGLPVDLAIVPG